MESQCDIGQDEVGTGKQSRGLSVEKHSEIQLQKSLNIWALKVRMNEWIWWTEKLLFFDKPFIPLPRRNNDSYKTLAKSTYAVCVMTNEHFKDPDDKFNLCLIIP